MYIKAEIYDGCRAKLMILSDLPLRYTETQAWDIISLSIRSEGLLRKLYSNDKLVVLLELSIPDKGLRLMDLYRRQP